MELKDCLTNEVVSKRFENQFDLVNYAIGVAQEMIHSGRGPRVKTETENPALQVLEEIVSGLDTFEIEESGGGEEEESGGREQPRQETSENSTGEDENNRTSSDATNEENTEKKKVLTEYNN